ncbi:MAG: hypothetical protein V7782_05500 [Psychromonas sp.]
MKSSLNILIILHLLFISIFPVQAETNVKCEMLEMQQMQSLSCDLDTEISFHPCCTSTSVIPFNLDKVNGLDNRFAFVLGSFSDYQNALLSEHATPIFRPPIIHSVI